MVLLGLLTLAIGGVSAMSDAHTMRTIRDDGIERAVRNGCPFVIEPLSAATYIYLPTKEKCSMRIDPKNKEKILVNQRNGKFVFNVTKWEKMKQNRDAARKVIAEAKEKGANCFKANLAQYRTDFRTNYLFDLNTMECTVVYEVFPYIGKYETATVITDENGKWKWINTKSITREEFYERTKVPWGWNITMPMDIEERKKQWRAWTL